MGFLSFVGYLIVLVICVGLGIALIAAGGFVLFWFVIITMLTGWIPILMCATDPDWNIQWTAGGFVGKWAFICMVEYVIASLGILVLMFVRPDPDGLPPAWKFLSMFYVSPSAKKMYAASGVESPEFDFKGFRRSMGNNRAGTYSARVEEKHVREATAHAEAEAERMRLRNDAEKAMFAQEMEKARKTAYEKVEEERRKMEEYLKRHGERYGE